MTTSRKMNGLAIRDGHATRLARHLAEEVAIALVYQQTTQAVLMSTPSDLEDLATGFSLTEGIVAHGGEIESLEIAAHEKGIELRMWIAGERAARLAARRRYMAGPVGCGLCGIDSLEEAQRSVPTLPKADCRFDAATLARAPDALRQHQSLHDRTGAVHAAGFLGPEGTIVMAREDVGRHNALDKLVGALAREGIDGRRGAIVMTSRVSIELVQKCAMARVPLLVAVSAPTVQAVRLAEASGIALAGSAREGRFELFADPCRIVSEPVDRP
ncbi:FdhD protein [Palleronia aestuarii]|uniref:Sulfur carrier protein FdhD n=1 Tax=Palleronia aestuarii TaxID=568105 RepID=A0A2W7NR14_9RHOB|nr:formate dehydrogenase accessory sulfurtransferase FdhD [Palleronia aestuarii]PZX13742.1 FdhD protein [Palleronia aestuarii]